MAEEEFTILVHPQPIMVRVKAKDRKEAIEKAEKQVRFHPWKSTTCEY